VIGLGSAARMNVPGRRGGNWRWRFTWRDLTPGLADRLRDATAHSARL
jgi:4-alpha-glucanotransferase